MSLRLLSFYQFIVLVAVILSQHRYVQCKGLNEEFTWSRISYVHSTEERYGGGNYDPQTMGAIVFPDSKRQVPNLTNTEDYIFGKTNKLFGEIKNRMYVYCLEKISIKVAKKANGNLFCRLKCAPLNQTRYCF